MSSRSTYPTGLVTTLAICAVVLLCDAFRSKETHRFTIAEVLYVTSCLPFGDSLNAKENGVHSVDVPVFG